VATAVESVLGLFLANNIVLVLLHPGIYSNALEGLKLIRNYESIIICGTFILDPGQYLGKGKPSYISSLSRKDLVGLNVALHKKQASLFVAGKYGISTVLQRLPQLLNLPYG
jgi:hypothetical protein